MRINFFCQFNHTGVGRHCENAYIGATRVKPAGVHLHYVDSFRDSSVRGLIANARPQTDTTLFFWRAPAEFLRQVQGLKIGWLFFEADRLPPVWVQQMGEFDQLWMPSGWAREVLLAHGLPDQRIRVIESGVNQRIYFPRPIAHQKFVLLFVGKYEVRKSLDETIEAYFEEFPANGSSDTELWIKADHPVFPARVAQLQAKYAHDPRVRFLSGRFSDAQMASLYNRADAFVFPSKAEGFGLPCIEALACGLPVITTDYSAQTAFLQHVRGLFFPVEFAMADVVDPDQEHFYGRDYAGIGFGRWATPSIASIRSGMREVYENRQAWRERARQASEVIRETFAWERIARKAIDTALAS